ncbi:MAG: RNA polymerase sigma factor RpoD/SigA [Bacteroidetes bacterium]|nr:RNA polymerase sigma factor RpoD/SigA [Bacteroidota bacterium]MDA1121929.1 RNA polymerase sigma factor RpoD/SigA [Bacteroidota bacterium]
MRQLKISQNITNRESQSLEKYFNDVNKVDLLTVDEEVDLAKRIHDGDQLALEKLVKANLRFVVSVAKQYQNRSLSLNDLINEGNLGLIKAAQKFDHTRGFKFISYAVWWIRQSIMQALAEQSRLIRLPLNRVGSINKINQAASMLEQGLQRMPTEQELAEYLGLDVSEIKGALDSVTRQVSVDAPFGDDDSGSLLDVLEDKNVEGTDIGLTYTHSLRVEVERSLSRLSERERQVIKMFFGIGCKEALSLEQIGEILDLSTERVRQIKEKALSRLRMSSKNSLLAEYLG